MGLTLPIASRDNVPIIKFPAAFANMKKVKKNLRFVNSNYFKESLNSKTTKSKIK